MKGNERREGWGLRCVEREEGERGRERQRKRRRCKGGMCTCEGKQSDEKKKR